MPFINSDFFPFKMPRGERYSICFASIYRGMMIGHDIQLISSFHPCQNMYLRDMKLNLFFRVSHYNLSQKKETRKSHPVITNYTLRHTYCRVNGFI